MNALITGGTRGIGKATADLLQEKGWDVVGWGSGELTLLKLYISYLLDRGWIPDVLILCAGEWFSRPHLEHSWWNYERHFNILGNHWKLMFRFLPFMFGKENSVVIGVASTRAFIGGVETGPYSVAKAGLVAMMQGYAREYGRGVRVNCVCPGLTDTALGAEVVKTGGAKPGTVGQPPEAVAQAIISLIEDKDANGKILRVVDRIVTEARWVWE